MIDSLYKLFLGELKFFEEKSYFASQSMKNQDDCGELVELAIRKFLREIIGERFKITHGYIYSSANKQLSPQIDIIITDTFVPHNLKRFDYLDNLEIVPVEAVVAIFELKRTLRPSSLKAAGVHLQKIFDEVPLQKDRSDNYLPGGIKFQGGNGVNITGGKNSNPLLGIIGLLHENSPNCSELPWFIDTTFSFQGFLRAPKDKDSESLRVYSSRSSSDQINYKIFQEDNESGRIKLLKGFISYLLRYLDEVTGRSFDMNAYFS
jgi:hypothetical protein